MKPLLPVLFLSALCGCSNSKTDPVPPAANSSRPAAPAEPVTPTPIPDPDPAKGPSLAWVGKRHVYAENLRGGDLDQYIYQSLLGGFKASHKLEATDEQVNRCVEAFKNMKGEGVKPVTMPEFMARGMVEQWLLDKALYEKYGGTVIFQQANPFEPVGAYRAFFEEQERRGRLKIYDAAASEKFWGYLRREHPFQAEKEDVDFSRPWWEKAGEKKR